MANPVQLTGLGFASGVRTDSKRNRKPRKLLNVKSLGKINHVLDISDADVNECMTSVNVVSEDDINMINIPCPLRRHVGVSSARRGGYLAKQRKMLYLSGMCAYCVEPQTVGLLHQDEGFIPTRVMGTTRSGW